MTLPDTTDADRDLIDTLVRRARIKWPSQILPEEVLTLTLDLTYAHAQCNLKLETMLKAFEPPYQFLGDVAHDIDGIRKYMNRDTGRLPDWFDPRFSQL
jgi:hypothetical protein